jgi:carboxymethylenebutenolidase
MSSLVDRNRAGAAMSRRAFVRVSLAAGAGWTLFPSPARRSVEPFLRAALRDPDVIHGPASFASGGQLVRAHVARPAASGRHPVVLVNHGNPGLPEDVVAALAHLAQRGYAAITFDTDTRSAGPIGQMVHAIDFYRSAVFADQIIADNDAALAFMRGQAFTAMSSGVAMLGFCGGGWSVLRQATRTPDVRAVAALYAAPAFPPDRTNAVNPRPNLVDFIDAVRAPIQLHYGDRDTLIPVQTARELEAHLHAKKADAEVFYYENAGHAFCDYVHADYYNESAAKPAYERIDRFLRLRFD